MGAMMLGEELCKKPRFKKVYSGDNVPIHILHSTMRKAVSIDYRPDIYYITKLDKKIIFEIFDKEL
jgi:hypothetical protein